MRSSTAQKLDYWLQLVYPSIMEEVGARMDRMCHNIIEKIVGLKIPLGSREEGADSNIKVPIDSLDGKTFQSWILRLPIRLGGLGIRSNVETAAPAFIGGVEQALSHFTGQDGICKNLQNIIGDQDVTNRRWEQLLQSGCRTGREFAAAWQTLQAETLSCFRYLQQEPKGLLQAEVAAAGGEATDGSTRRKIVQEREEIRVTVLTEAISRVADKSKRFVMSWTNRDKLSSAFLHSLPSPDTGFTNVEFSEAVALLLCLPSPACVDRVGEKVGRKVVDKYGNNVMNEPLPGDTWRIKHDSTKTELATLADWAGLPCTVEVFGLFSHLISQPALMRLDTGRKRQGLVPDFKLRIPTDNGVTTQLAELKMINCSDSYYKTGGKVRGVERRAERLPAEYRSKARKVDQLGQPDAVRGPCERRLDQFGELGKLVFGAFGEASEDVHSLITSLAECRLRKLGLQRGRVGGEQELALITGQIRRRISTTVTKANVNCLVERMQLVGPGNSELGRKREYTQRLEQRLRLERRAVWQQRVEGTSSLRKGFIKTV